MIEKLSNKKEFDIIDIGANIGVHTLQFAKNYEKAKIYSILNQLHLLMKNSKKMLILI